MKKYIVTEEEYRAVKKAQKENRFKRQDKLLEVVAMRYEGYKDKEIGLIVGYDRQSVSRMIVRFKKNGLEYYIGNRYKGNHRNLSEKEETAVLKGLEERAKSGQFVGAEEVRRALEEKLGRKTRPGYVYDVMHRHNWRNIMPRPKHPEAASQEEQETAKKEIGKKMKELREEHQSDGKHVRLMFQDEAGYGRINTPKRCWCPPMVRPDTPCLRVREYQYAYGAVDPVSGENFFLILPYCNTTCMNLYLEHLGKEFPNDMILLAFDRASWHTTKNLKIPENITLFQIPPYTPEMNPIEQIWKEIRKRGFKNEFFPSLEQVVDRLAETIRSLRVQTVSHITLRSWIKDACLSTG